VQTVHKEDFPDLKQIGPDEGFSDKIFHRCRIILSLIYIKIKECPFSFGHERFFLNHTSLGLFECPCSFGHNRLFLITLTSLGLFYCSYNIEQFRFWKRK